MKLKSPRVQATFALAVLAIIFLMLFGPGTCRAAEAEETTKAEVAEKPSAWYTLKSAEVRTQVAGLAAEQFSGLVAPGTIATTTVTVTLESLYLQVIAARGLGRYNAFANETDLVVGKSIEKFGWTFDICAFVALLPRVNEDGRRLNVNQVGFELAVSREFKLQKSLFVNHTISLGGGLQVQMPFSGNAFGGGWGARVEVKTGFDIVSAPEGQKAPWSFEAKFGLARHDGIIGYTPAWVGQTEVKVIHRFGAKRNYSAWVGGNTINTRAGVLFGTAVEW